MKKQLTTLILTATLGIFAGAGARGEADIYDITPCGEYGEDFAEGQTWSSVSAPLGSGETVYFKLRLLAREISGSTAYGRWRLDYDGLISPSVVSNLYPMQIGIYVSGVRTYAVLDNVVSEGNFTTALIFKYTTKPGDFAMPIRLATATGPAGDTPATGEYFFDPSRSYWKMRCETSSGTADCSWLITTDMGKQSLGMVDIGRAPRSDFSLEGCGIYVQTVDFSDDDESSDYWRSVHENSTITGGGISPRLAISAPSTAARTFYVWSEDETKLRVKTDNLVTMQVDESGTMGTFHVGKVTFAGGQADPAPFLVEALPGSKDQTVNLVLSAYSNYNFRASSGARLDEEYVTAKVKCIEALPASVMIERADQTIVADGDHYMAKTSISFYLSQAVTNTVKVTIRPSFENKPSMTNWWDYVRFSEVNEVTTLPSTNEYSYTFSIGSTEKKTIYVYALRGDNSTVGTGNQVLFTAVVDPADKAAAGITGDDKTTGLWISAAKPVITEPNDTTPAYTPTAGESQQVIIAVSDTYADMTDTNVGYTVMYNVGSGWKTLPDKFKASGEGGELVGLTNNLPPTIEFPTAGDITGQIKVTAPISQKTSETVQFPVRVSPAKTTSALSLDPDPDNYTEGDVVRFRMALSAQNDTGAPIYAFLLCNEEVDLSLFGGTAAKAILTNADVAASTSVGRQISSVGTYVDSSFTVLDGLSADSAGQNYTFSVVLCSKRNYDPNFRLPGYDTTEMLNITVYNREPTITTVSMNGFPAESDGYTFPNKYPMGQDQTIQTEFDDVVYDLKHGFEYKWTATCNGQAFANGTVGHDTTGTISETTITTNSTGVTTTYKTLIPDGKNINEVPFVYNFPYAGIWTVKIQMKDKDMTKYSVETYTIHFETIESPAIEINVDDVYAETDTAAKFSVGLGYYNSTKSIVVKLTVTPPEGDNPGTLLLDGALKAVPSGYAALADNEYYVSFRSAEPVAVSIESMDGTARSSAKGFAIKAEVVTTDPSIVPGKTWAEYYLSSQRKLYIENTPPVPGYVTSENTNAWVVAGGAATSYPINWSIRSAVEGDFTNKWANGEGPGIKVTFQGCQNATTFYVTDTNEWSGTFIPNFGGMQGDINVVLTIEDKDQGLLTWTYMYTVKPSKFLVTIPNGPVGFGNNPLSQKYVKTAAKGGRGEGHVYAQGATFSDGTAFRLNWNCSSAATVDVYAWGYRVGMFDNGWLNGGMDAAITSDGTGVARASAADVTAGYYPYPDAEKDSFLYAWLISTAQKESAPPEWTLTIAPEEPSAQAIPVTVYLPTAMTDDGAYIPVYAESVFSKEWVVEDNLGDINQDGIPDYFAMVGWGDGKESLIASTTGGDTKENDLTDLAGGNPDADFLPGVYEQLGVERLIGASYQISIGGHTYDAPAKNSYAPVGIPFSNRLELRGFHDGLNETQVTKSDVSFSISETNAYKAAFKEANGRDWEDTDGFDLSFWSPEPRGRDGTTRMDPTLEDTDADNFPDGWEYYFWYMAKVWVPGGHANGKPKDGQKFVFERFVPGNILVGAEIAASDVLKRFDPCIEYKQESFDLDNDGLTDLEELLIGTNPCHWDTDGDHLCDGWEIMMCLDPLNGSSNENPDGDYMAFRTTFTDMCYFEGGFVPTNEESIPAGMRVYGLPDLRMGSDYQYVGGKYIMLVKKEVVCYSFTPKFDANGENIIYGLKSDIPEKITADWVWGFYMVDQVRRETITLNAGDEIFPRLKFVLIHDQVHDGFGFDPRTGWGMNANGYVSDRWDPKVNIGRGKFLGDTGRAINTRPYATYDEYLVMKYRMDYGIDYSPNTKGDNVVDPNAANTWEVMGSKTTNPNVVYPAASTEEEGEDNDGETATTNSTVSATIASGLAQAFAQAGSDKSPVTSHGADTDGDGVPDGWELYMYRNPNAGPSKEDEDGLGKTNALDFDDDGLSWVNEYAGVDSCNAYKDCASIYQYHPGNVSGWFNKFFPTNPGTMKENVGDPFDPQLYAGMGNEDGWDTDLDGVPDAVEGGTWFGVFATGGRQGLAELGFVYGTPEDGGLTNVCFRGGGMNPCTIDTDLDGLPAFPSSCQPRK